ncbi:MAG: DUF3467 domain-containing protein [bacterium]
MANSSKKQGSAHFVVKENAELPEEYVNESAASYSFANFARVTASPSGMLLSFGKIHPKERKILLFDEILLPFEVADALVKIIQDQFAKLEDDGLLQRVPPGATKGKSK